MIYLVSNFTFISYYVKFYINKKINFVKISKVSTNTEVLNLKSEKEALLKI